MNKSNIKSLFGNDYSITILKKVFMTFFNVMITALTIRALGPELRGQYTYNMNMMALIANFLSLGIQYAYSIERKNEKVPLEDLKAKYFAVNIKVLLFYLVIGIFLFAAFYDPTFSMIYLILPFNVIAGQIGNILLIEDIKYHSLIYMLSSCIYFVLTVIVFLFFKVNLTVVMLVNLLVFLFLAVLFLYKLKNKKYLFEIDLKYLGKIIKLGFIPMITAMLKMVNYNFDTIMLKHMGVDLAKIGYYSIAVALAGYIWYIPDIFKDVSFSKSAKEKSCDNICFSMRISNALTIFVILGIVVFGKIFITVMYGKDFINAYAVSLILILGTPAMGIFNIISPVFNVVGLAKFNFNILLKSAVSNIILNLLLIPLMGIEGAALASVVSYSICGVMMTRKFVAHFELSYKDVLLINANDIKRIKNKFKRG